MARGTYCSACGYDLAALPAGLCPECAKPFNPTDAASFDAIPRRTRRARLIRRAVAIAAALGIVLLLAPRGYVRGSLTFSGPTGATRFTRIQLIAPRWMPLAYPGWLMRGDSENPPGKTFYFEAATCTFTMHGLEDQGQCSAWASDGVTSRRAINDQPLTPENAPAILSRVLKPMAAGEPVQIRVGLANVLIRDPSPASAPGTR